MKTYEFAINFTLRIPAWVWLAFALASAVSAYSEVVDRHYWWAALSVLMSALQLHCAYSTWKEKEAAADVPVTSYAGGPPGAKYIGDPGDVKPDA